MAFWFISYPPSSVIFDNRGYQAILALSKELDLSYWKAWTMIQKICRAMKDRDAPYQLAGIVEIDDSFFGGQKKEGGDKGERGGSKTIVIVEASKNGEGIGYARMTVVDHIDGTTIEALTGSGSR